VAGTTALGAVLLSTCGGSESKQGSDARSLFSPIVDESKNVISGGVWKNVWLGGGATGGAAAGIYTTAFIDPTKAQLKKS
jgi:hypothetical protein